MHATQRITRLLATPREEGESIEVIMSNHTVVDDN
jgi:hypothetical protein